MDTEVEKQIITRQKKKKKNSDKNQNDLLVSHI